MYRYRQRRRSASDSSRVALEVSTIRGRWVPATVPSSGMDTWKSDSTSSSSASVSTSTRSTSSISSTTGSAARMASSRGRVSRNGSGKVSASTSAQPGAWGRGAWVGAPDGLRQGPGEQERLGEDVGLDLGPAGVVGPVGLDAQQLLLVVPLVQGLGLVQALVALEPDQPGPGGGGQGLGQLGLADPGWPLGQDGLLQPVGQEGDVGDHGGGQVVDLGQAPADLVDVGEPVGHQPSSVTRSAASA